MNAKQRRRRDAAKRHQRRQAVEAARALRALTHDVTRRRRAA